MKQVNAMKNADAVVDYRHVSLSVDDVAVSNDGVEGFYWPASYDKLIGFGYALEMALAEFLRNYEDERASQIYKIAMKNYVCIVCSVFQSDVLSQAAARDGVVYDVPGNYPIWPYSLNKDRPLEADRVVCALKNINNEPGFFEKFYSRIKRVHKLYKKINFGQYGVSFEGFKVTAPNNYNLQNDIIATKRTELIVNHARSVDKDVFLVNSKRWFSVLSDRDIQQSADDKNSFIESAIFKIIAAQYETHSVIFEGYAQNYLKDALTQLAAVIRAHLQFLDRRTDLPCTLWTGTGGNIWDLMLRYSVMNKDGCVIAHDHGGGTAHLDYFQHGWVDLMGAHQYITYNPVQVEEFKKAYKKWPVLDKVIPEITCLQTEASKREVSVDTRFQNEAFVPKNIMLMSTYYSHDSGRGLPLYPSLVYMDWQARVISHLKGWGYNVYFKPHPESLSSPPEAFETKLGAKIVSGNFEDLKIKPDLIIFDLTNTSVFRPTMFSNTPVVIVDFGIVPFYKRALKLLQKRCSIVRARFDTDNRMQVVWGDLKKAIEAAPAKANNREFIETYHM